MTPETLSTNPPFRASSNALDALANVEAEAALLGAMMIGGTPVIDAVADRLAWSAFVEPAHTAIFEAILSQHSQGRPATPVTLRPFLATDSRLDALGGLRYLARLTSDGQGLLAHKELADQIADLAARRDIRDRFIAGSAACANLDLTLDAIAARGEVPPTATPGMNSRTYVFGDAFATALDRIDDIASGKIAPGVMLHGLQDFDDITKGLQAGDFILLGGRPSMGKTALSLGIARRAAEKGHGVLYISREMDIAPLMERMLADMLFDAGGKSTFQDIREGRVSVEDRALLTRLRAIAAAWPLVIIDPERFGADEINFVIRRQRRKFEGRGQSLDLVIIDYLGLIEPPPSASRNEQVTAISQAIKLTAKSTRIPILVLSQLSRGVEQREDKHPQLTDLRDSGSLEQDADVVIFVYREQYYLERSEPEQGDKARSAWEESMREAKDKMEVYTAKNRQGVITRRRFWFFGRHQAVRNSDFFSKGAF